MQLSYSLKDGAVGETCGRSRETIIITFESCARFGLCMVFVEQCKENVDCSPKIYIIERLRKIDRGR